MTDRGYRQLRADDGTPLAYRVSGNGVRVVLVHGFTISSAVNFSTHCRDDGSGGLMQAPGPTVESALTGAGCQVALLDLLGHGYSGKPHEPGRYSMEAFAADVRALAAHLGWERAALAGYSLGAAVAERLLGDRWVSRAALCGISSWQVEGVAPDFAETWVNIARCFLEGCWQDYPGYGQLRSWADLAGADFTALRAATRHLVFPGQHGWPWALLRLMAGHVPLGTSAGGDSGDVYASGVMAAKQTTPYGSCVRSKTV